MISEERPLLEKMSATLDDILVELRAGRERHKELDQSNAAAEHKLQNPYDNV
jgi:hypothetical protein